MLKRWSSRRSKISKYSNFRTSIIFQFPLAKHLKTLSRCLVDLSWIFHTIGLDWICMSLLHNHLHKLYSLQFTKSNCFSVRWHLVSSSSRRSSASWQVCGCSSKPVVVLWNALLIWYRHRMLTWSQVYIHRGPERYLLIARNLSTAALKMLRLTAMWN